MFEGEQFLCMYKKHISDTQVQACIIVIFLCWKMWPSVVAFPHMYGSDYVVNNKGHLGIFTSTLLSTLHALFCLIYPIRQGLWITLFYRYGNWGLDRFSNGVQVTQLGRSRAGNWTPEMFPEPRAWPLSCDLPWGGGVTAGPDPPCRLTAPCSQCWHVRLAAAHSRQGLTAGWKNCLCLNRIPLLSFAGQQVFEESDFIHCSSIINLTSSLSLAFAERHSALLESSKNMSQVWVGQMDPDKTDPDIECGDCMEGSWCLWCHVSCSLGILRSLCTYL